MHSEKMKSSREYLLERTGRLSQLGGISSFLHADGRAKGVATLRVRTASGLEYWIVPDRGMDIFECSWRGRSLCWHSPVGVVHPAYSSNRGVEWLRTFAGGLLTTCGLTAAGAPSVDDGEDVGLHGSIANTPAEGLRWSEDWIDDDCALTVYGQVREVSVLGHHLVLKRRITSSLQSNRIIIQDAVENQGIRESPLMLLYHFNFGYPLLTPSSRIFAPSRHVEPATELAAQSAAQWHSFEAPAFGIGERVYFHDMEAGADEIVKVVLVSDRETNDFGICLRYSKATLPEFVQWKMPGANHYVLGLEPANCRSLGRAAERARGTLKSISPGMQCEFRIELQVLEGAQEVETAIQEAGLPGAHRSVDSGSGRRI
jgi:Domain of unknown function (DUF4432)